MPVPFESDVELSPRLEGFLKAWADLEADRMIELYTEHATHRGPGVLKAAPDRTDATLHGAAEIRDFIATVRSLVGSWTLRVTWVQETETSSVVELARTVAGRDRTLFEAEIIEWDSDQVAAVRAYDL